MGGGDDLALLFLAVDNRQARDRHLFGGDEVLEDIAGADRGQLVGIAYEQQMGARRYGLEQRGGEARVEHRGFVDDEKIRGKRRGLVGGEAAFGWVVF